ncbi:MAG: 4-hydroxy-3-methylbut-2-enyl diphosphate reductase [Synergistetes bacterium]|nr:4-hydroxy-3-methylbut-2-enyl diphosphate reductase [Synergistota bacterium]
MFNIRVAESAGFCFGVKRAINIVERELKRSKLVYTFGEIIHNRFEVDRLASMGVQVVNRVDDIKKGDVVVIRAHGIPFTEERQLKMKGARVVDATCPLVKDVQQRARMLRDEGYQVVVFGNREHPEVKAIVDYSYGSAIVVAGLEDVGVLGEFDKLGFISQTTKPMNDFISLIPMVFQHTKELRVFNTVCPATFQRQDEARKLAKWADVMIVVGGYNSSNTTNLALICKEVLSNTYHVESESDIDRRWFLEVSKVGVTAGASTPQWMINRVVKFLLDIGGKMGNG